MPNHPKQEAPRRRRRLTRLAQTLRPRQYFSTCFVITRATAVQPRPCYTRITSHSIRTLIEPDACVALRALRTHSSIEH